MQRSITWDNDPPKQQGRAIAWDDEQNSAWPWYLKSPVQLAYGAARDRLDPKTRNEALARDASRLSVVPRMFEHGFYMGASDERDAVRAQRGQSVIGRATNALTDYHPFGWGLGFADAGIGVGIDAFMPESSKGNAFREARDESRAVIADARERHPVTSFSAELAGGAALPGAGPGKSLVTTAVRGAASGAALSGLYGFNEGQDGTRGQNALIGGLAGGVLGGALGGILGAFARRGQKSRLPGGVLEAAPVSQIPDSSRRAFGRVLRQSGLSGDDVDGLFMRIEEAIDAGEAPTIFTRLVTEALEETNPQAAENVRRVWRQLQLEPSEKSDAGQILTSSLDDQARAQTGYIDNALDDVLGEATIADEFQRLEAERTGIGQARDEALQGIMRDGRNRRLPDQTNQWASEYGGDREVQGMMRTAARQMGFRGPNEAADAMTSNPVDFLNKFQEITFAQSKTSRGASPVAMQARDEAQAMLDDATRFVRSEDGAFAPAVQGAQGPYKQRQLEFRQNYSQQDAINDARGRLAQARDPYEAQRFTEWFQSLPSGEQAVVRTVIKNDIGRMIRGGKFSEDLPWLTNIDKRGVHEVLITVLGDDGVRLSRFLDDMRKEGQFIKGIDPRPRNGQPRYELSSRENAAAANLYTENPLGRFSRRNAVNTAAGDIPGMIAGQMMFGVPVPPMSVARVAGLPFRPSARTREGLAKLLAMRVQRGEGRKGPQSTTLLEPAPPPSASGEAMPSQAQDAAQTAVVEQALRPRPAAPQEPTMAVSQMRQRDPQPASMTPERLSRLEERSAAASQRLSEAETRVMQTRAREGGQAEMDAAVRDVLQARDLWLSSRLEMGETLDDVYRTTGRKFVRTESGFLDVGAVPEALPPSEIARAFDDLSTADPQVWPSWYREARYEDLFRRGDSIPDHSLMKLAYGRAIDKARQAMRRKQAQMANRRALIDRASIVAAALLGGAGAYGLYRRRQNPDELPSDYISSNDQIQTAQQSLIALGLLPEGSDDGMMGPNTRQAILNYQKANGLEPTGRLTTDELVELSQTAIAQPLVPAN